MIFLGIDPGKTTGLALIRVENKIPTLMTVRESKNPTLSQDRDLFELADLVIMEDWKTRPKKAMLGAFNYDPMITPRVIGAAELMSELCSCKVVMQQPAIKPVGYGYANLKYVPGKKGLHIQDAIAHVMYYLVSRSLSRPVMSSGFVPK